MGNIKKVCIIEDEVDLVEALTEYFQIADYEVTSYHTAEDFYTHWDPSFKGVYLVDWNLPGEPGIEIIKYIRSKKSLCPVFMVSAFSKNEEIITGLKAGADDYITKPYSMEELLVRVENATSRLSSIEGEVMGMGLKLLPEAAAFINNGKTVNLTLREFIIFEKLHKLVGTPVSREELMGCFAKEEKMTIRNIDVHIFALRKKIADAALVISTVWGHGYKLDN